MGGKIYHEVFEIKLPKDLKKRVISRVFEENSRIIKRNRKISFAFSFLSFVATIGAFVYTFAEFQSSGFYTYLSLMFSNMSNISTYWGDLGLALAESLPVYSVLLLLSTLFVFVFSLMKFWKNKNQDFGIRYA